MKDRNKEETADRFWDFSLKIYAAEGVASECLALQDQYCADVNVLLFCAYLGVRGIELAPRDIGTIVAVTRPWHEAIVKPLRTARRAGKSFVEAAGFPERKSATSLRNKVKALELAAERIEHGLLTSWAADRLQTPMRRKRRSAIAKNISLYLQYLRVPGGRARTRHLIASTG